MKSLIVMVALASTAAVALPAAAQEADKTGAYVNLGYTHSSNGDGDTGSISGKGGWRFHRYFGAEVEGAFGISGDDGTFVPVGGTAPLAFDTKQQYQVAGYGVGFLPLGENFDLFARVGYGTARYKVAVQGQPDVGFNQESWNYGGGVQYSFDGANGVRAEYTRASIQGNGAPPNTPWAGSDQDNWSLSYVRQF